MMIRKAIAASTSLVLALSACGHSVHPESSLRAKPSQSRIDLRLVDGTELVVRDAELGDDDVVRGRVVTCAGPGCDAARGHGVPLADVSKMTSYMTTGEENAAWVVGSVLLLGGVVALAVGMAASSSTPPPPPPSTIHSNDSCPRMYSWNGTAWQLDSGTFGGSLFAAAQLTDHDVLEHLAPQGGKLRMRLKNELPETEHTDAISLRVVDHPDGTSVVPTASGTLLTFRHLTPPVAATDLRGADVLDVVGKRDEREWTSDLSGRDPARLEDSRDGVVLEFPKPRGARRAKVWITARNTPWASNMLEYLLSQLGPALPGWYATMNGDPVARKAFSGFMEKEGSLVVQVKTPGGWVPRGLVSLAGPEILKDQALEVSIDDVPGDRVTLRLDAPVAFWSIDSVAVSFEDDEPVELRELSPVTAVADDGTDVSGAITAIDGAYYSTVTGNVAELSFDAPAAPRPGSTRSYILVSTGYYVPDVPPAPNADAAMFLRVTSDPDLASRQALALLNLTLARGLLR